MIRDGCTYFVHFFEDTHFCGSPVGGDAVRIFENLDGCILACVYTWGGYF